MNSQSVSSPALSTLHMTIPKGRTFLGWPPSMGLSSYFRYMNFFVSFQCQFFLLTGVTLRGALAAWWENEGELVTTSPEFEFPFQFPCCFPSIELSDFRQSARSGDERECKQTLKNTSQRRTVKPANRALDSRQSSPVEFPRAAPYMAWVFDWFPSLLHYDWVFCFLWVLRFSFLSQNQHF